VALLLQILLTYVQTIGIVNNIQNMKWPKALQVTALSRACSVEL
jgi:hypothetical protein